MLAGNYFKTALRNLTKNKLYSAINIGGLAIGFVCTLLIALYIQHELSYDKYHKNFKRIYRIESDFTLSGKNDKVAPTPIPFGPTFYKEFPEIESYVRFMPVGEQLLKYGDKNFYEEDVLLTDSTVFDVFSYKFLSGTPVNSLTEPFSIVLTKSMAEKYFGDEDPLGKIIQTGNNDNLKVTGIIEDVPKTSHIKFSALASMETMVKLMGEERFNNTDPMAFWSVQVNTFILLNKNASISTIHEKYPDFYDKYMKPVGDQLQASFTIMTTRLDRIHLHTNLQWDRPTGNLKYIKIFGFVALIILIIASINYMNLATARSGKRAKEVGIRKVSGAFPTQLRRQFMIESLIITFISFILAVVVAELVLPVFNNLTGLEYSHNIIQNSQVLLASFVVTVLIGLLSGSYPAFYMSSISAVQVLKGGSGMKSKGSGLLRKILVVIQFSISTAIIIGAFVVGAQIKYLNSKDIGFTKENIIITNIRDGSFIEKLPSFKAELLQHPNIIGVCSANNIPGNELGMVVFKVEMDGKMVDQTVKLLGVDYDYFKTMDINIVEGRNFDLEMSTDEENAFIVNEMAAKTFGWNGMSIGKKIELGQEGGQFFRRGKIIGVVNDFNFVSLHNEIEPIIIIPSKARQFIHIRVDNDQKDETLKYIETVWNKFQPNYPFDYSYLEDNLSENYVEESRIGKLLGYFAIIAIIISCLGLFGLSSFVTEQRIREIGIRKVLGASINKILFLLSKDFLLLVIIANLIAYPIAYMLLNDWLAAFAFSVKIKWFYFPLATLISVSIALLITNSKAYFAARLNPSVSLKYE